VKHLRFEINNRELLLLDGEGEVFILEKVSLSSWRHCATEVLVEWVSNLQPADECEGGNFFPTIRDFGELILEEIEVQLEVVCLLHSDSEKMVAVSLNLLVGGICFSHLSEVIE